MRRPAHIVFRLSLASLLITFASYAGAQTQFRFDSWTTDNGLPQASITSILQTRDGFMWFATFGGLVRYDGLRFQVFNTGNSKGLRTGRFINLFEDREGNLWIATEGQGLTRYKDEVFTTYTTEDGLPYNQVGPIGEDTQGNLIIHAVDRLLSWKNERFVPYPSDTPVIGQYHRTYYDAVWYMEGDTIKKVDKGKTTVEFKINYDVRGFFEDRAGRLWMGTREDVLNMYQDGKIRTYSAKDGYENFHVSCYFEDSGGSVWIGSNKKGLFRFKDGRFNRYTLQDGLAGNEVRVIYQDREGTLWVGTETGLSRMTERVVTSYSEKDGIASDKVYPIFEDRKGTIWIGSWYGLTRYENGVFTNVSKQFAAEDMQVSSLLEDKTGGLWVGAWGASGLGSSVRYFKDGKMRSFTYDELPAAHVRTIIQDRADNIWFGTSNGLVKYSEGRFKSLGSKEGFEGKEVQAIYEDRQGNIWIGADNGLTRLRNGEFKNFTAKDGLANNIVRSIYEDDSGTLWIGMYDTGLYRLKDGQVTHYNNRVGLFDNGVFRIIEDRHGNFWISCNLGIYRLRKDELNAFAEGRIKEITCIPYNKRDGMLNPECNGGGQSAGIMASDGRMWFPTQGGVAIIDPDRVPVNRQPPLVVIESFVVDTQPVSALAPLKLQPGQVNLEIHYSGLSFINPELVKFKYKLEGLDGDWVDVGTRRTAYYAHLPPGNFTFKVIAANRDGIWTELPGSVAITMVPPFWRTTWFLGLVVLTMGALTYLYYRWRISQFERARKAQIEFARRLISSQEVERKRIAAELHDSLGQALLIIKNRAELSRRFLPEPQKALEQIEHIEATAAESIKEVRHIAYDLRPYQLDEIGLTQALKDLVRSVSSSCEVTIAASIAPIDDLYSVDEAINMYRIVQEALNNIVKHSGATKASVTLTRDDGHISLNIEDNGRGFNEEDQETSYERRGFGLTGLAERARILGAVLTIKSTPGHGTSVLLNCRIQDQGYAN
jgi:signal transduction histidine kinase/ligand-binding sensor domain-containing protein